MMSLSGYLEDDVLLRSGPLTPGASRSRAVRAADGGPVLSPCLLMASDLFPAVYARRRKLVANRSLVTVSSREVRFSGERFDQRDLDVMLLALRSAAEDSSLPRSTGRFRLRTILGELGRRADAQGRQSVLASLQRLETARLELDDRSFVSRIGLIDKLHVSRESNECVVEFNPDVTSALREAGGLANFCRERMSLGQDALAKWIHGISYAVRGAFLIEFQRMRKLCGLDDATGMRFEEEVRQAAAKLKADGLVLVAEEFLPGRMLISKSGREDEETSCRLFFD